MRVGITGIKKLQTQIRGQGNLEIGYYRGFLPIGEAVSAEYQVAEEIFRHSGIGLVLEYGRTLSMGGAGL
jgi:hypothetical protein